MWLLDTTSYELKAFLNLEEIPGYAILSHTWGDEEVSFQDIKRLSHARTKKGFRKIEYCCQQALREGLSWAWVDTCCIDKTSSAELSEAINSMFSWYSSSATCYAFLEDVNTVEDMLSQSKTPRWFTRGWTLQELIAPLRVEFYTADWQFLGTLSEHKTFIVGLTGITEGILDKSLGLDDVSVATRMSWASRRRTARKEDEAYCLLGIFGINMPLIYGEGEKAFRRLLNEIITNTEDQTVFLWGVQKLLKDGNAPASCRFKRACIARSPSDYEGSIHFRPFRSDFDPDIKLASGQRGMRITAKAMALKTFFMHTSNETAIPLYGSGAMAMSLCCSIDSNQQSQSPESDAADEVVAIIIRPRNPLTAIGADWLICGHYYIPVPRKEVEAWSMLTCYFHDVYHAVDIPMKRSAIWKTPRLGYLEQGTDTFTPIVFSSSQFSLFNAQYSDMRLLSVAGWGTVLDSSDINPWVLIMFGYSSRVSGVFCDVWVVPERIKQKLLRRGEADRSRRAIRNDALFQTRQGILCSTGNNMKWGKRQGRAGLCVSDEGQLDDAHTLTAAVSAELSLFLYIRKSPRRVSL
ncbi:heterokaryon incompatibility protein-domain-containing protein [Stachybotrys elegans]|uniref:Heterokaryon incompatibility protein-domain-containing protein n=1 Tax=Stachybotrys elegans TaxID=80388 RepID=A0A8K0T2I5_9HYPO|nr:heterokaryon incompatibility protein-domain-containing protein [Stachybotrys elegans]